MFVLFSTNSRDGVRISVVLIKVELIFDLIFFFRVVDLLFKFMNRRVTYHLLKDLFLVTFLNRSSLVTYTGILLTDKYLLTSKSTSPGFNLCRV